MGRDRYRRPNPLECGYDITSRRPKGASPDVYMSDEDADMYEQDMADIMTMFGGRETMRKRMQDEDSYD